MNTVDRAVLLRNAVNNFLASPTAIMLPDSVRALMREQADLTADLAIQFQNLELGLHD